MAESVFLALSIEGGPDPVNGESTQTSMAGEDTSQMIELVEFKSGFSSVREQGNVYATGRRTHQPFECTARLGPQSPYIAQALARNQTCSGAFSFFRSNRTDGAMEKLYTISFTGGRIDSQHIHSPNNLETATAMSPPMEVFTIVFHEVIWTYEPDGIEAVDTWGEQV
jgi:type VI secretion system secreted protein Hcp